MKSKFNWKVVALVTTVLMAVTCSQVFATVAPSVAAAAAPTLVAMTGPDGEPAVGYFIDAEGNIVYLPVGADNTVTITSDADFEATLTGEALANYQAAKNQLMDPTSDFYSNLNDFIAQNYTGISGSSFVVKEIFDVDLSDSIQDAAFADEGNKLGLTFEESYNEGDMIIVIVYNAETGAWDFIGGDDIIMNDDGTITVNFPHMCPVAFLTADASAVAIDNTDSAQAVDAEVVEESSSAASWIVPIIIAGVVIVGAGIVISKKKKSS